MISECSLEQGARRTRDTTPAALIGVGACMYDTTFYIPYISVWSYVLGVRIPRS